MEFVIIWIILGAVVAMVANSKGRSPIPWFFYGAFIFPVGLTHALLLKPQE
jgi:hypothetical protein